MPPILITKVFALEWHNKPRSWPPAQVLIDEADKASAEFLGLLLEVIEENNDALDFNDPDSDS